MGEDHINHIFDDGGTWVQVMWEVVGQHHFPGIQKLHIESLEHGTQHSIKPKRVPLIVQQNACFIYLHQVGSTDHHQSSRLTVQQMNHCFPDVPEAAYIYINRKGVKVSPYTQKNYCVWPTLDPVQLICYIGQC